MESLKIILYLLASLIMAGVILICPGVADTVSIFYVSILSTYLGLDVWGMIKTTSLMPPGEYKDLKVGRYVLCAISYAVLIILGYVQSVKTGVDLSAMYSVFISAIFLLVGLLIGGLEGNKIATSEGEEKK